MKSPPRSESCRESSAASAGSMESFEACVFPRVSETRKVFSWAQFRLARFCLCRSNARNGFSTVAPPTFASSNDLLGPSYSVTLDVHADKSWHYALTRIDAPRTFIRRTNDGDVTYPLADLILSCSFLRQMGNIFVVWRDGDWICNFSSFDRGPVVFIVCAGDWSSIARLSYRDFEQVSCRHVGFRCHVVPRLTLDIPSQRAIPSRAMDGQSIVSSKARVQIEIINYHVK